MSIRFPATVFLLHGKTGVGKTRLLSWLKQQQEPVLLLEDLAQHRGSAFGANGQYFPQPSQERFEQLLIQQVEAAADRNYLFMEQKALNLGKRRLPEWLQKGLQQAIPIQLSAPLSLRIQHIQTDYFSHPSAIEDAETALEKMKEKMVRVFWEKAADSLNKKDTPRFIELLLAYYDRSIRYSETASAALQLYIRNDEEIPAVGTELLQQVEA